VLAPSVGGPPVPAPDPVVPRAEAAIAAPDAGAPVDAARTPVCKGVAHSAQNFAVGGLTVPQFGQALASAVPHSVQNFAPGRFSVPHVGQFMERGAYRGPMIAREGCSTGATRNFVRSTKDPASRRSRAAS